MILAGSEAFVTHTGNTEYVLELTDGGAFDGLLVCITSGSAVTNLFPGALVPENRVILYATFLYVTRLKVTLHCDMLSTVYGMFETVYLVFIEHVCAVTAKIFPA